MSGKIILSARDQLHFCTGMPGMVKRIVNNIGLGSKWQCDDCRKIWVLWNNYGWGWEWKETNE